MSMGLAYAFWSIYGDRDTARRIRTFRTQEGPPAMRNKKKERPGAVGYSTFVDSQNIGEEEGSHADEGGISKHTPICESVV